MIITILNSFEAKFSQSPDMLRIAELSTEIFHEDDSVYIPQSPFIEESLVETHSVGLPDKFLTHHQSPNFGFVNFLEEDTEKNQTQFDKFQMQDTLCHSEGIYQKEWNVLDQMNTKNVHSRSKKYNISVCAIFKNEAKYLKEWIEYHMLIGIDHFYLYNIESTDRFANILKDYIKKETVTLINWPDLGRNQSDEIGILGMQIPAYENAIHVVAKNETEWLIFIDIDEFLLPLNSELNELVEKYKQFSGIVLPKLYFNAAQNEYFPQKDLVVESSEILASVDDESIKSIQKILFKPDQCATFTWPPYQFLFKNGMGPIQLNEWDKLNRWDLRVNCYVNRNLKSLKHDKNSRQMSYEICKSELYQLLKIGFIIEDNSMDPFVLPLKKAMGICR